MLSALVPLLGERNSPPGREAVLAALNGVMGDYLAETRNPLAIPMSLRRDGKTLILNDRQLQQLRAVNGVRALSLVVEEQAVVENGDNVVSPYLKGVDSNFTKVSGVAGKIDRGKFETGTADQPLAVLGSGIEYNLGVEADQSLPLDVYCFRKGGPSYTVDPLASYNHAAITTAGSFRIQQDFDEHYVITNLEFAHADIFENLDAIKKTFSHFIRIIPRNGLLLGNGDDANLAPLLNVTHCPVKRFGLGEGNAIHAFNVRYGPTATEFEIPSFKFHLNLVGELNVRNALAVIACAKHCGLKNQQIQSAFDTFKGIKRRMEVRGIAGGVTVVDDFGHHPTAIRETLKALRLKYPREKIWAIFEPRSNTTRRNVFQSELATAFADADAVVVAEVARLEQIAPEERLDPEKLMQDLKTSGKNAAYLPDVDAIVAHVAKNAQGGDIVVVFSNGGFGGIHAKLLEKLGRR